MALAWGAFLKSMEDVEGPIHRIVSSDLGRAIKTAKIINQRLQVPFSISEGMKEMDWGEWSGSVYKEIRKAATKAVRRQVHLCWKFTPPGGESRIEVVMRGLNALESIANDGRVSASTSTNHGIGNGQGTPCPYGGQNKNKTMRILIVTHGGVIRCLINYFLGRSFMWNEPEVMKPYHLHRFLYDHDQGIVTLGRENALALPTELSHPTLE